MREVLFGACAFAVVVACAGCQILFDLKSHVDDANGGSGGTSTTGMTGGTGGGGTTGTTSGCEPGAVEKCDYSGPAGTDGVGPCKAPERTCSADRMGWSQCSGEVKPKTEDCTKPGDEDCNFGGVGCSEAVWSKIFDGTPKLIDIGTDGAGNTYVYGEFFGALTFGDTTLITLDEQDLFLAKLDPKGMPLWAKKYGGLGAQSATGLAVDPDGNLIVAGYFGGTLDFGDGPLVSKSGANGSDLYVAKLTPDGDVIWNKQFGGSTVTQVTTAMTVDGLGDVLLLGYLQEGSLDFGGPVVATVSNESFMAKLDGANGAGIWAKLLVDQGGAFVANGARLDTDSSGGIGLLAVLSGTYDFAGQKLTADNAFVLARFDSAGNPAWGESLGLPMAAVMAADLGMDPGGDSFVTVATSAPVNWGGVPAMSLGAVDVLVAKLDAVGGQQWAVRIGGPGIDTFPRLKIDKTGRALVSFRSDGPVDVGLGDMPFQGKTDVVLAAFEPAGAPQWARRLGSATGGEEGVVVAIGAKGEAVLACRILGTVDFGNGSLSSSGSDPDLGVGVFAP
jgi:hypothetical protein